MTPEQLARQEIDRQLLLCDWLVQDYADMNISAGPGVAVREFPLKQGFADYFLYANAKAIGVIEAKPEGHTLKGVEIQSGKYASSVHEDIPQYTAQKPKLGRDVSPKRPPSSTSFSTQSPLPFANESTGAVTQFTNNLDPEPCSREVFTVHRPEELVHLAKLDKQLRAALREMPELNTTRLWRIQADAVRSLEKSLGQGRPRALIQMAAGSGKTYTACSFCYRLITFAKAKRILFLVDRNNLGKQTLNEFQQYASPYTNRKFTEEFNVQRLQRNTIDPAADRRLLWLQLLAREGRSRRRLPYPNLRHRNRSSRTGRIRATASGKLPPYTCRVFHAKDGVSGNCESKFATGLR